MRGTRPAPDIKIGDVVRAVGRRSVSKGEVGVVIRLLEHGNIVCVKLFSTQKVVLYWATGLEKVDA